MYSLLTIDSHSGFEKETTGKEMEDATGDS